MPQLPTTDRDRVRVLLSYLSDAVPYGDQALLERALLKDYSTTAITALQTQLTRCDRALTNSEINQQVAAVAYNRVIVGDVNRTDREDRPEPYRVRRKAYIQETDRLALLVGVRNYTNPANHQYLRYGTFQL